MIYATKSAVAITTETTVWTPTADHKFQLEGFVLASSVSGNLTFKDGTAGTTILIIPVLAGDPVAVQLPSPILSSNCDKVLTCTGPSAATLSGTIWGTNVYAPGTEA